MIILLSLVCAIQAFLTLWLYRKVTCMQAGILIAHLGSRSEVHGIKADLKTWKIRVASVSARLDMKENHDDALWNGIKVENLMTGMVYTITQEERDVMKAADKLWKAGLQTELEKVRFQYLMSLDLKPDDIECHRCSKIMSSSDKEDMSYRRDDGTRVIHPLCSDCIEPPDDPSFDEQHKDPDPPDEDPYDGSPADTRGEDPDPLMIDQEDDRSDHVWITLQRKPRD
jgi:hypothetical protein